MRSSLADRPARITLGIAWRTEAADDRRCRLTGGQRDDHAFPAPPADFRSADDGVGGVVAPLHDEVGAKELDECQRRVLIEDGDGINGLEASKHIGPLDLVAHWTIGPLQSPNASIAVQPDDQRIATFAGTAEDVEMSGMQEVEHPIGKDDPAGTSGSPGAGTVPIENLSRRVKGAQNVVSTRG